jgi:hypothetical protein
VETLFKLGFASFLLGNGAEQIVLVVGKRAKQLVEDLADAIRGPDGSTLREATSGSRGRTPRRKPRALRLPTSS